MLQTNFKIAWRYFVKDRQFTLLNLIGLSAGLACAILIYVWVSDELEIDNFHKNDARLYQVMENRVQASGIWIATSSPGPMADALAKDMPEVEYSVIATPLRKIMFTLDNQKSIRAEGKYAGKDFFRIFSYDLIAGDATTALADKHTIVLSDLLAIKLFGTTENLIGKSVGVTQVENQEPFKITGIFRAPGPRSSEQFDFIIPIQIIIDADPGMKEWGNTFANTFVLLKPGVKPADFNRKIADFIKRETNNEITYRTPFITRYSENYLYGRYENGIRVGGRIDYVKLFSLIAVFILVIACINFMNLSTAKAAERAKEVGIKKVLGAGRQTLIRQYLSESMLMAFAAMLLAVALVLLILPFFNQVTGKSIVLNHPGAGLILAVLGITLFTGLIAGSYPALYLSRFKPASVLKGKLKNSIGELIVRKGLVVFQFTLSIILITGVIVVYRQMSFIQNKNLGYDRDHVISFLKEGKLNEQNQQEAFLAELRNVPGVVRASAIGHSLTGHSGGTNGVEWEGKDLNDKTEFEAVAVDYDMLETLGFSMKEGRAFSKSFGADTTKIIFNEAAIRFMGLKNPVGKTVKFWDNKVQIIGVVRDFHFQSLHEKVKPLLFYLNPQNSYFFMARIQTGKEKAAIDGLQALYKQFNPGFSLQYSFLDENYQQLYTGERRVSVLSRCFAGLAILISCLGLFGLTAFTAERRSKEIGIRKVLGASATSVVVLLSTDFLKLALLAIVVAFPIAWWATSSWLSGFVYHVDLGASVFLFAGVSVILITLLTVSFRSVRAALANPVKSLKAQ
jgi:putative ABC transport system permease protein